ncbi:MAG TPA: glycosyltransferase family 39 protein [Candidatus Methanoperedens sp.]|nr:glycosyltransferase family 39 protein [Candidatus Methanoperedens sp.]
MSNNLSLVIFLFLCTQLYFASLFIIQNDPEFNLRWLSFWSHLIAVLSIFVFYISKIAKEINPHKTQPKNIFILLFFLIFIGTINFFEISNYPFVSLGDEVRDGGLNAMEIATGTRKNLFEYGAYDAHGLVIPTITSFSYRIFQNSVLTYRIPAAIFACFDVILVYIILKLLINQTAGLFGALVLCTLPLHMFFARTQIVVSLNSFLSSATILSLFLFLKRKQTVDYIFMGTILGFTFNFHAAIRVVAILVLLFITSKEVLTIIKHIIKKLPEVHIRIRNLILLIVFCFVGFGPRILFTNSANFLHTSRFFLQKDNNSYISLPKLDDMITLKNNYIKSLLVWFYEPTFYFFGQYKPILTPFLTIFFFLGIIYSSFLIKKTILYFLLSLVFVIPFFNSAITDVINADHRLSPMFPVGAIFIGIGISYTFVLMRNKYLYYLLGVLILGYLLFFQTYKFFQNRPADIFHNVGDYLTMHTIQFLKSNKITGDICLLTSPDNTTSLNYPHYSEQFQYFLPNITVQTLPSEEIRNNEIYIYRGNCLKKYEKTTYKYISCSDVSNNYHCPLNFNEVMMIHYQE